MELELGMYNMVVMHMEVYLIPMELIQVISEKVLMTLTARLPETGFIIQIEQI